MILPIHLRLSAQVTTSTLGGTVADQEGKPLANATVEISFPDPGIKRHMVTGNDWGVRKYSSSSGYFQPISYVGTNAVGQAMYQFDPAQKKTFTSSPDLPSRWQIQFGLRYIF